MGSISSDRLEASYCVQLQTSGLRLTVNMKLKIFLFAIYVLCMSLASARAQESGTIFPNRFHDKLEDIPDNQKFVGAGVVGFIATRLVVGSAMGVMKAAAVVFIT